MEKRNKTLGTHKFRDVLDGTAKFTIHQRQIRNRKPSVQDFDQSIFRIVTQQVDVVNQNKNLIEPSHYDEQITIQIIHPENE